jgi:hypothetical protein
MCGCGCNLVGAIVVLRAANGRGSQQPDCEGPALHDMGLRRVPFSRWFGVLVAWLNSGWRSPL